MQGLVIDVAATRYLDLPGPRGLPWLGNALQLRASDAHQRFEAWSRRFGRNFRMTMGPRRVLVSSDPALIGAVLRDRPDGFRRPSRQADLIREMGFERGLFFVNDEAWKRQRRMVMSAFNPAHVKAYFPSLLSVTLRLQERWAAAAQTRRRIDLQADLMRFTVDAVAGLAFGAEVNTLESDDDVIQRHLNRIFPVLSRRAIGVIPYWRWLRLPSDRALDRSVGAVRTAIDGFIAAARQRLDDEPARRAAPHNLLEAMLAATDLDDGALDDRDVAGNVLVMLLAGEDTTANTLAWLIYLLRREPEALQRVRAEVRERVPGVEALSPELLAELPYLDACIHETMRLKPVAPLLPMQAVRDITVAGIEIPAGTIVVALMRPPALAPEIFPEPERFRPDRWLAADSSASRASMPFGAGPRLCPGRYLALLEIKMAMAMLLGHFEIESVASLAGGEPRELLAFAMGPSPMHMTLAPGADDQPAASSRGGRAMGLAAS